MKTKIKLLELTSDVVFKVFMIIAKTEYYRARLIHLITGIDEERVLEAEYVCKEFPINNIKDKVYKSDIVVIVEQNILNIEMNKEYKNSLKRIIPI